MIQRIYRHYELPRTPRYQSVWDSPRIAWTFDQWEAAGYTRDAALSDTWLKAINVRGPRWFIIALRMLSKLIGGWPHGLTEYLYYSRAPKETRP